MSRYWLGDLSVKFDYFIETLEFHWQALVELVCFAIFLFAFTYAAIEKSMRTS